MDAIWYDAIILAVLAFCTWRGAAKGFAWQIATIGAIVLCFIFAETASVALAPTIPVEPPLNRWIAMFILYIAASFASFAVARMIRGTLKKWQFEEFDSHLGAVFGFVKGIAFALVITFFAVTLSETLRGQVLASYSGHAAGRILVTLHPVLPDGFHGVVDPYIEKLGQRVVHDKGHDHEHDSGHPDDEHQHSGEGGHHHETGREDFGDVPWHEDSPRSPESNGSSDWQQGDFGRPPERQNVPESPPSDLPSAITGIERLIEDIPDDLKHAARNAWLNTSPEDRDELRSSLQTKVPEVIRAVSQEWANGKPADFGQPKSRREILREIAGVYSQNKQERQQFLQQAESALLGVPDRVAEAVLQDWYADLFGFSERGPDPATDLATPFDVRIRRQLERFGISLDRVRADLRERLQGRRR